MIWRVLIIGGYGNFGSFITKSLAKEKKFQVIVAGRSVEKSQQFISDLEAANEAEYVVLDINDEISTALVDINPKIVIHTSGPFQDQGYSVARACIKHGAHYIDLSDGRRFVEGITVLDAKAKEHDVLVVSGASSVPCLSAALIDYYLPDFDSLETVDYGITTAQKTARGLATTAAILSYTGKPFNTLINGKIAGIYGWQGLHVRKYEELGLRLLGNCDVPDLSLFPVRYPTLKTIRFYAGLEIWFVHITLWSISWLVRFGLIRRLERIAPLLLRISYLFDWLGSSTSAFHMELSGKGKSGEEKSVKFELIAKSGDGPYIPCLPAILMAKKLVNRKIEDRGAYPCVGFISRDDYLGALKELDISWAERQSK